MQCKCIENKHGNTNFVANKIYKVEENVGICCPMLIRFDKYDNPGKLETGKVFEFGWCKFEVL